MTSIILPFVISNGDTRVLAEVGSLLKSVFATWSCSQAADIGTQSRWQVFNSNTTHQPACNDLASWKYVGGLHLCVRFSLQFSCVWVKRQWQQWQVTFLQTQHCLSNARDKRYRSTRSTQVPTQHNFSVAYNKQSASNEEKRQANRQRTAAWQCRTDGLKINRCGFV